MRNSGAGVGFLWFEVSGHTLDCQLMTLPAVSAAKGYGPVGHPLPHLRDYPLAWENSDGSKSRSGKDR